MKNSSIIALRRFLYHPVALDRGCRPEHQHALGFVDLLLDDPAELLACRDHPVPPHGPAVRLQRLRDGLGARAILSGVADEDVAHPYCGARTEVRASKLKLAPRNLTT